MIKAQIKSTVPDTVMKRVKISAPIMTIKTIATIRPVSIMAEVNLLRDILPLFRKVGINEDEIRAMLVDNPRRIMQFI